MSALLGVVGAVFVAMVVIAVRIITESLFCIALSSTVNVLYNQVWCDV